MTRLALLAVVAYLGWRYMQQRKEAGTMEGAGLQFDLAREPLPDLEIETDWTEETEAAIDAALKACHLAEPGAPLQRRAACAAKEVFPGFPWPPVHGDHPSAWEVWHRIVGRPATPPAAPLTFKGD